MRTFHVPLALAVTLLVCATASPQDRPGVPTVARDRPATPASGTAKLKGRVLTPDGTPLRRAQVSVTAADIQVRRTVTTGSDGRWEATALPAGRYIVSASKPEAQIVPLGVSPRPALGNPTLAGADGTIADDGTFTVGGGSGRYSSPSRFVISDAHPDTHVPLDQAWMTSRVTDRQRYPVGDAAAREDTSPASPLDPSAPSPRSLDVSRPSVRAGVSG